MRKWHFFWWLCSRTHLSLKNFSKKNLLVVAHKQRYPSNSEPNWPSYLFPLSPSILPVPEKPWLLIWSTSHTPLLPELRAEIWPTKQAIFAMFLLPAPHPPPLWYHRAPVPYWWKAQEYPQRRESSPCVPCISWVFARVSQTPAVSVVHLSWAVRLVKNWLSLFPRMLPSHKERHRMQLLLSLTLCWESQELFCSQVWLELKSPSLVHCTAAHTCADKQQKVSIYMVTLTRREPAVIASLDI